MQRNYAALFQQNPCDHDLVPDDELATEQWIYGFDWYFVPADVLEFGFGPGVCGGWIAHAAYLK